MIRGTFVVLPLLAGALLGQAQLELRGTVSDGSGRPLPGIVIRCACGGEDQVGGTPHDTREAGAFKFWLPSQIRPGNRIRLFIDDPKWILKNVVEYAPGFQSELKLVAVQRSDLSQLTDQSIKSLLAMVAEAAHNYSTGTTSVTRRHIDRDAALSQIARTLGLQRAFLERNIRQWASAPKSSFEDKALAAQVKGDFAAETEAWDQAIGQADSIAARQKSGLFLQKARSELNDKNDRAALNSYAMALKLDHDLAEARVEMVLLCGEGDLVDEAFEICKASLNEMEGDDFVEDVMARYRRSSPPDDTSEAQLLISIVPLIYRADPTGGPNDWMFKAAQFLLKRTDDQSSDRGATIYIAAQIAYKFNEDAYDSKNGKARARQKYRSNLNTALAAGRRQFGVDYSRRVEIQVLMASTLLETSQQLTLFDQAIHKASLEYVERDRPAETFKLLYLAAQYLLYFDQSAECEDRPMCDERVKHAFQYLGRAVSFAKAHKMASDADTVQKELEQLIKFEDITIGAKLEP